MRTLRLDGSGLRDIEPDAELREYFNAAQPRDARGRFTRGDGTNTPGSGAGRGAPPLRGQRGRTRPAGGTPPAGRPPAGNGGPPAGNAGAPSPVPPEHKADYDFARGTGMGHEEALRFAQASAGRNNPAPAPAPVPAEHKADYDFARGTGMGHEEALRFAQASAARNSGGNPAPGPDPAPNPDPTPPGPGPDLGDTSKHLRDARAAIERGNPRRAIVSGLLAARAVHQAALAHGAHPLVARALSAVAGIHRTLAHQDLQGAAAIGHHLLDHQIQRTARFLGQEVKLPTVSIKINPPSGGAS